MIDGQCATSYTGDYEGALGQIERWISEYGICNAVVSGSGLIPDDIMIRLKERGVANVMVITSETPVPLTIEYTRQSLGLDRLATAVGAAEPDKNILIMDAGTALTLDLVSCNRFVGGNISPGLRMRFKALNDHCIHLPLAEPSVEAPLVGKNTMEALSAGVTRGFINEIIGHIEAINKKYGKVELVLTGGDAGIVGEWLDKAGIDYRKDSDLLARGMTCIYEYYDNNNRL